jgi:phosphoglycolate phosphatase-like HAD superfamily hydrolase/pyrimidine operon attenuation protein/uracil phosphoribosyltransferase
MVGAVIFDLDTLVDLAPLATVRRQARWAEMAARLDEVVPYPTPDGSIEVLELTRWVHELGVKVGVLTDLPGPVAKGLAERFQTSCNKMIDASEGLPVGPEPAGIEVLCERLEVPCGATVVVGASMPFFGAAARTGALSAGVSWAGAGLNGWGGWQPDVRLGKADDVVEVSEMGAAMRPLAEVLVEGESPTVHWGSVIEVSDGVFAAGRYFTGTDRRLSTHKLSRVISASKASAEAARLLGEILAGVAERTELPETDLVVSVPGRPDAELDRFGVARVGIAEALGAKDGRGVLAMVKDCENYLDLDRDQRRMANHGRFRATRELAGERVVLIDGVMTTGAMTRACARELMGAGAGEVWTLVAGVSQDAFERECPSCGVGKMRRVYWRFGTLLACTKRNCDYRERWDG